MIIYVDVLVYAYAFMCMCMYVYTSLRSKHARSTTTTTQQQRQQKAQGHFAERPPDEWTSQSGMPMNSSLLQLGHTALAEWT